MINKSIQFIGRIISASIVIGITAFFTPGFDSSNIWIIVTSILALSFLDFLLSITDIFKHPIIKLIIGFVLCGISLFIVEYVIVGYLLSIVPLILGSMVYGLVDYVLPNQYQNASNTQKINE